MITGTQSSGTDFLGVEQALKQTYAGPFNNTIEGEMEVETAFNDAGGFETTEGSDGKQINLGHYIAGGGGVSFVGETDYVPDSVSPTWKQGSITIKQVVARLDLSQRVMNRVKAGPAAFADWADMALTEKAKRVAFHKDRALVGLGTGIIGRINGTPDGTGDAIDDQYGIASLGSAINLLQVGDALRFASDSAGSSLRTGVVVPTAIDYNAGSGAGTFNSALISALLTAATATSGADNDYVALGGTNVTSFGSNEIMGLEGMLDDGTNLTTFQGVTRSAYPSVMNAQIVDSTTTYGGTLSEDAIDYADSLCWERAGGRPDLLLVNRNGQRSFWKSLKGDRVLNDPQGVFTGGKRKLGILLGDREVEVRAARKVPSSRAYLIDRSTMKRFRIGAGKWDDTTGSVWRQVQDSTGAKMAFYALWTEELQYACIHPAKNAKLTNLVAA